MHSAHPGGCCNARELTVSDVACTKTVTGKFGEAEFGTDTGFDARPPDRRPQHPSASGDGQP